MSIPLKYGEQGLKTQTAVLLLGFGGPEQFEDVRPFIENVTRGRNIPAARIEAVVEQYKRIGGSSPFNKLTAKQASAIAAELARSGRPETVYVGMLYWDPYLQATVRQMLDDGITRATVIVLSPHRSEASFERYVNAAQTTLASLLEGESDSKRTEKLQFNYVDSWHLNPLFIEAVAGRIYQCIESLSTAPDPQKVRLIFTAHSIPTDMAERSDYAGQIEQTASSIVDFITTGSGKPWCGLTPDWCVGYQSRSGSPQQPWLEPDVSVRIREARDAGKTHVLVVPIGFVCDNAEVLFDLDVLAAEASADLGMIMLRAETVGNTAPFISLLAQLARETSESYYAKPETK